MSKIRQFIELVFRVPKMKGWEPACSLCHRRGYAKPFVTVTGEHTMMCAEDIVECSRIYHEDMNQ